MPVVPPAFPGTYIPSNLRTAGDLLVEISGHLVEDIVNTTLTADAAATVAPATSTTLFVADTLALYPGAFVTLANADGTSPTVIEILSVDLGASACTAFLTRPYLANSTLLAGTFPTQQPTDPLFTQDEILGYLARAQNEFLAQVPCVYTFSSQNVDAGVELQALPPLAIELERVAINGTRLYETTTSDLTTRNPQWQYYSVSPTPQAWFEDRAGYYGWGLAPTPAAGFACILLTSQRGPDSLGMLDLFLIPDPIIHVLKYKALQYIWSKAGAQRSPSMARIAAARYDSGIAVAARFLSGMVEAAGTR